MLVFPASAYATTSGGLARKLALISGLTRPSKLRLPDKTADANKSVFVIASATSGRRLPELPIHVVQP